MPRAVWTRHANGKLMKIKVYNDGECFVYDPSGSDWGFEKFIGKTRSFVDALALVMAYTGSEVDKIEG